MLIQHYGKLLYFAKSRKSDLTQTETRPGRISRGRSIYRLDVKQAFVEADIVAVGLKKGRGDRDAVQSWRNARQAMPGQFGDKIAA